MTYDFLVKAQSQPDLKDFCEYLKKPLMVLQDIETRYKQLQLNKKVDHENLEIYHKCDKILQKYLPEMVDNFCDFSFDYRNNQKIQIDSNTSLTAKELLLKKLSKIVEEVQLIEKDFNKNNSFTSVVQNKVLEQYGFQPELSSETGKVVKKNIELQNKFDYEKFVETNEFKKPSVEINKKGEPTKVEKVKEEEEATPSSSGSSFLTEIVLVLFFVVGLGVATYTQYAKALEKNRGNMLTSNIDNIKRGIQAFAITTKAQNYNGLSNNTLIESYFIKKENLTNPWGQEIKIQPATIEKPNDAFALDINLVDKDQNESSYNTSCLTILNDADTFEMVKLDDKVVKMTDSTKKENIMMDCVNGNYKTASLIGR